LAHFEKHLAKWEWKYLAGDNLTASDFHLFGFLTGIGQVLNTGHKTHPHAQQALSATLNTPATPHLNAWVAEMYAQLKQHMETRP